MNTHDQEPTRSSVTGLVLQAARCVCALSNFWPRRGSPWLAAPPDDGLDSRTGLLQEHALFEMGEPLLHKTRQRGEPFSLLLFDFRDLFEVETLYGAATRRQLLSVIGRKLRRLAGGRGLAVRLDKTRFAVLLPGMGRDKAMEAVWARIGKPCVIELEGAQEELVIVPSLVVVDATADTGSIAELLEQCRSSVAARRVETFRPRPLTA